MLLKSTLFKWVVVIGTVSVLTMAAGAMSYSFLLLPRGPGLEVKTVASFQNTPLETCAVVINIFDYSTNEDDFRVYRRNAGTSAFTLIQNLPPKSVKGRGDVDMLDAPLPPGTYQYKASALNAYGETFSLTQTATVNGADCANVPVVNTAGRPPNPLIVDLSIINNCSVRIKYRDNSTNEQGFRIYRAKQYEGFQSFEPEGLIATLGAHNGIPGKYDDTSKLDQGVYHYRMSAYNASGASFSNYAEIKIDQVCNPTVQFLPTKVPPTPIAVTLQKLSDDACTWDAAANVFLRKGPDVALFDRLADIKSGQSLPIIGQSEDGKFWAVEVSPGVTGYITKSEKYSRTTGDCGDVPTLKDPALPEVAPVPTKKPGGASNPSVAQCSDGVDNDGDGHVDFDPTGLGDSDCSSADDTSE